MKSKHFIALLGLSACFVCSSLMNSAVNKNNITPPDSFLPGANEGNGDHQSGKTGTGHSSNHSNEITKLKVTFDLNGGTYNNEKTYILNSVLPTSYFMGLKNQAPGYGDKTIIYNNRIFKGYSLAKDDPNIIADSYVVRDNITVYAQYDIDPSKDCVVRWLDATTTLSEETYAVGDIPTFKGQISIKEGKGFVGWNPTPKVITEDDATAGTIEYVANYIDITNSHLVTLDYGNGDELHTQTVVHNGFVVQPQITYAGHRLLKWTYESGGGFSFSTPITSDGIKIVANWELDTCNITYVTNGGALGTSHIDTVPYGNTITAAPELTDRPGYVKENVTWWATDKFTEGTQFKFGEAGTDATLVKGDLTLFAKWPSIKQYTVTFYDGNTVIGSIPVQTINYGEKVYRPENPTKTNYTFNGWYTATDYETVFPFDTPLTGSSTSVNVYAKFTKNQYRVRWLNADINHAPLINPQYYDAGELPVYDGAAPTLAPDLNHRYKFKGFSPEILPVDDNMTYFATYDYDDEINFHYISDSYPLNGEFDYLSVEFYGGLIAMEFDSANTAETVLSNASFTIDGTSYTKAQLSSDLYQGETEIEEEVVKTNYLYLKVSYVSTNAFVRNARSIEMEAMFL